MNLLDWLSLVVPVALAFACGVAAEGYRAKQRERRIRRIMARALDWD